MLGVPPVDAGGPALDWRAIPRDGTHRMTTPAPAALTDAPAFVGFPSIPRLLRDCIVTEKIDGTNASVWIGDDGTVRAGSRSRWITPADDNFGFAAWVAAHADELRDGLGAGHHYGEWYGAGIQRKYGLAEKRFALFNVSRWETDRPACCDVVPVLYRGPFDTAAVRDCLATLAASGSRIAPGFMQPEGIVVFHVAAGALYKVTLDKNDGHKSERVRGGAK
jgi:hypothetical protein